MACGVCILCSSPLVNGDLAAPPSQDDPIITAAGGYVDALGFAHRANGSAISPEDACGKLAHLGKTHAATRSPEVVVDAILGTVTSKWSYKFFHFIVEALPRIALLLQERPQLFPLAHSAEFPMSLQGTQRIRGHAKGNRSSALLLVSCKSRLVKEALQILGVDVQRSVLCWKLGHTYKTSNSLLWPAASPCGGARQPALRALRRFAMPPPMRPVRFASEVYSSGRVVLHERTGSRRMTNHDEVLAALLNTELPRPTRSDSLTLGTSSSPRISLAPFVTVLNGNGTVALHAQIELFRSARCQVGPHGAGMALMLFAPTPWFGTAEVTPGAYFVEIRGKPGDHLNRHRNRTSKWVANPKPNACYRGLAATMGQRHEWLVMSGMPANEDLSPEVDAVIKMAFRMCTLPLELSRDATEAAAQVGAG